MGEMVTIDRLMKDLNVLDRLDSMIDRALKRLLYVRGLKSLSSTSTSTSTMRLPSPQKVA
jgi:hypothetical protein